MMQTVLRVIQLTLALAGALTLLIVGPAIWLGIVTDWHIVFLAVSYLCFFIGTVWRVLRYGQLASREQDEQVKETSGRFASLITVAGLIGFHWLSLYTFSTRGELDTSSMAAMAAICLTVAAIVISQIAIRTLGKFFDRLVIKSDHQLIKEGIYSFIRHPIYTSYILLFLGFCTMLQSLAGFGLLVITCAIWFGNRISIEEKMLENQFGEDYKDYCHQTKRLFPYIY